MNGFAMLYVAVCGGIIGWFLCERNARNRQMLNELDSRLWRLEGEAGGHARVMPAHAIVGGTAPPVPPEPEVKVPAADAPADSELAA